eukprot:1193139-Prorocentrum_minimum.AAC.3
MVPMLRFVEGRCLLHFALVSSSLLLQIFQVSTNDSLQPDQRREPAHGEDDEGDLQFCLGRHVVVLLHPGEEEKVNQEDGHDESSAQKEQHCEWERQRLHHRVKIQAQRQAQRMSAIQKGGPTPDELPSRESEHAPKSIRR